MPYALQRTRDGKFVARPGSQSSYVAGIENARAFATLEEARRDQCGNERILEFRYVGAFRATAEQDPDATIPNGVTA